MIWPDQVSEQRTSKTCLRNVSVEKLSTLEKFKPVSGSLL